MDVLIQFAMDNWPWLFYVIVAGVVFRFLFKFYDSTKDTDKKVSDLETLVVSHSLQLASFQKSVDRFDAACETLNEISKWVIKKDPRAIDMLAPKHSPRRLSPVGILLYQECGAEKALDDNKDFLLAELKKKDPKTAYDVEDKSCDVLLENLSNKMFNGIKNYLYNEPETKELTGPDQETVTVKLSLFLILRLMSIVLRDEYLKVNPLETSEE